MPSESGPELPFAALRREVQAQTSLRAAITAAYRRPEPQCLPPLIEAATLSAAASTLARKTARKLVEALRDKQQRGGVEGLVREYALSSDEGVALMCLAEALLRIPDSATRDALIRDKIGGGDWRSHLGHSPSLFVNAATWGLVVTGKLTGTASESTLSNALIRLVAKGGEPLIRRGVDLAMRMMGEQFVMGQTIGEALARARTMEAKGFRYSYDMLGEAATTAADASRYLAAYERAIHAIGTVSQQRGIYEGPGISIKLSALHPRYCRAQRGRVFAELLPRLKMLALVARRYDIGLNIDAEEADRLDLSLDLLEAVCLDPEFEGWNGIGFVVQAYQKRAAFVLDFIIDLARRSHHRLMIRLVKGAYWDSEIKRAQVDGLEGFPVFTRKIHTDVSYIACARKLLGAPDAVYPQFATHNALTLATIHAMAGGNYYAGQYEFQCLHGMGEPLYEEVVGRGKLNRPCRIYAPVGTHETLLAYLVRRLLENGANSSFVNRIANPAVAIDELIADPVTASAKLQPVGAEHERIVLPRDLYGAKRENSTGLDLGNEHVLAVLAAALPPGPGAVHRAVPLIGDEPASGRCRPVFNPADRRDRVGKVEETDPVLIDRAFAIAVDNAARWAATAPSQRAATLDRAAALMQARMAALMSVMVREAGKSLPNAVGEVREAIDFLRYYAAQIREHFSNDTHRPLGPVVCISPWNFPLSIFTGQVAAALAAGNPVLAKPAEETPLIASLAVAILREAGVPSGVVQLLPGVGRVGAALVGDIRARGVMFTGSTEVARLIQGELAKRTNPDGKPVPLIAETGGQNALIVDSSALAEQVVGDVIQSAFDSAGQRCSALRVLCLQEEVADRILAMLKGALREIAIGNPDQLAVDVGPVITAEAKVAILDHIEAMRSSGHVVDQLPLPEACRHGTFVPPTLIEIGSISELKREVFGPVLHVLRFRRDGLDRLLDDINATGYALTFGLHTRIDETVDQVVSRVAAGNIYLNRNLIGAVVGVQPFGGHGLSGTGPKAGGPLYLYRLLSARPFAAPVKPTNSAPRSARLWVEYLVLTGSKAVGRCAEMIETSPVEAVLDLTGPVGERNLYMLKPRGSILCIAGTATGLQIQIGAALASGNRAVIDPTSPATVFDDLPLGLKQHVVATTDRATAEFDAVLLEGDAAAVRRISAELAIRPGPIIAVHALSRDALASGQESYPLEWLLTERSVSINTTAAGGNASLMSIS
jgi:RHH-type transcriptional regulator, proline utilization regulon repressor / proline dehydrogenase / delta 1-pyrroline-5-carboxylate dehydrogenase